MRRAILALLPILMASPALSAPSIFQCRADGHEVIVQLGALTMWGHTFNCIGADFVDPYTPCAAPGAFALYADAAWAKITAVVDRPEDYATHTGGIISHTIEGTDLTFIGGYTSPDSGYVEVWSFTVMQATRAGLLKTGTTERPYTCTVLM